MFFMMTLDSFTGPQFLTRLKNRHDETLADLIQEYLPQIYRAARGAGLTVQNAEDVAQNTFVTFMEKLDDFEGRSHVRTWLFGILYRKISEMRRGAIREEAAEDIDDVMEHRFKTNGFWAKPPRATDASVFDTEVSRHLDDCLEGVTTDQRLAFVLREVQEMDSEEICESMGVSRSNLGVLLYRGRNKLRECLENRNIKG
jgi:RNA polymerase sigma-70 factor, ECF subfamily